MPTRTDAIGNFVFAQLQKNGGRPFEDIEALVFEMREAFPGLTYEEAAAGMNTATAWLSQCVEAAKASGSKLTALTPIIRH